MQILQQLQEMEEKDGKTVTLKEDNPNEEIQRHERSYVRRLKSKRRPRAKREVTESEGTATLEGETKETKDRDDTGRRGRVPRKRRMREPKGDGDQETTINENNTDKPRKEKSHARKSLKPRVKANIDFSLKLSNIKSDVRVRDLKDALLERGVRPSDITWLGQRGFCYLHFGKLRNKSAEPDQPVQVDSIVANLQKLRLGESVSHDDENREDEYIVVEPAKPITRIEITDVTAV